MADVHGVCLIPREIAKEVAGAAAEVEREERPIIELAQSPDFSVQKLRELLGD